MHKIDGFLRETQQLDGLRLRLLCSRSLFRVKDADELGAPFPSPHFPMV
jgi:hypothetical protein